MLTLCLRTDKPEAELYLYSDDTKIAEMLWQAHRELSQTILQKIEQILTSQGVSLNIVDKIGVYSGPGSFTGLRIGLSVANTLAYALHIPVVGASGESWLDSCLVQDGHTGIYAAANYGSPVRITQQKK